MSFCSAVVESEASEQYPLHACLKLFGRSSPSRRRFDAHNRVRMHLYWSLSCSLLLSLPSQAQEELQLFPLSVSKTTLLQVKVTFTT